MGIEAAIIGSSVIGGGLSLMAGDAQADAARAAGDVSWQQYMQMRADMEPWRIAGTAAIEELGRLYGFDTGAGDAAPAQPQQPILLNPPRRKQDRGAIDTTAREVDPARLNYLTGAGRNGDTEIAHVTPGEVVVPTQVVDQPQVRNSLTAGFRRRGLNPDRYIVGSQRNSLNPRTGRREFFGPGGGNPWGTGPGPNAPPPAPSEPEKTPEELQQESIDAFYASPDYRIAFDEGQKMIEGSAAARGGLFSGNTGVALTKYGQDYGNRLYNQYANRLMGIAGLGQTSAYGTGMAGANFAGQYGNYLMYGGQAQANQYAGFNNAIQAGLGNYMFYDYMR